jgi:tRNA(Ile)-lysidine synthase
MPPSAPLPRRFAEHFGALGAGSGGAPLLVAVSGGCDSVVLLHLLRFALPAPPHLHAAHFDHAMRPGSAADAAWVRGLCTAWDVPLLHAHADTRLRSETSARDARYRFLRAAAAEVGAAHVVTAHHADDQAETVLFRMLRGTGIDGLAGMRALGPTGIVRPLLPFWRAELAAYARRAGLRWRRDPTNDALTTARNRIRHRLLPDVERSFAPGARRALVRLAEQAREEAEAWEARLAVLAEVHLRPDEETLLLARDPFRRYDPATGARLLRYLLRNTGARLDRAGTRQALQFITGAPSGRRLPLPGGWELVAEWEQIRLAPTAEPTPDRDATIDGPVAGTALARLGGRSFTVRWTRSAGDVPAPSQGWAAALAFRSLGFPLQVRGWSPGDRIRLQAGSRRLKKLFGDRRVPRSERSRIPLLVDGNGSVLWVAGVVQAPASRPGPGEDALHLTIVHGTDRRDSGSHGGA